MIETMLVRASGGGWEELRPQTSLPEGGLVDLFGEDIGPVLGTPHSVVVAACAPPLSAGAPDALCVDPNGGIWIVQLALGDGGETTLSHLLASGGALNGMSYEAFEGLCDRRDGDSLGGFMEGRTGGRDFHRQSFEVAVAEALAGGRFRLVAIVREAAPTLVQSMRFLNAAGANAAVYEATSFASSSVTAVRAKALDVGLTLPQPANLFAGDAASSDAGDAEPTPPVVVDHDAAAFIAATSKASGDDTGRLLERLQSACLSTFDAVEYVRDGDAASMHGMLESKDGSAALLVAGSDGSVVVSFEALGTLDAGWDIRDGLCQGMERLLGTDLGDVRKISQLNLSVGEHLMDATLMEALAELLTDTVAALRAPAAGGRSRARATSAA